MIRFLSAVLLLLLSAILSHGSTHSSLESWRKILIDTARDQALAPNLTVRNLAMVCIGAFECLNAEEGNYSSILGINKQVPNNYLASSAVRGCMIKLCTFMHPSRKERFLNLAHQNSVQSGILAHNPSFLFGEWIALKILDWRKQDGASTTINYIGSEQPGKWRRTPPHFRPPEQPNWGNLEPFCIASKQSFMPPPPPNFGSQEYYDGVKEVKIYGSKTSSLRTKDQTECAIFWKDFSYSSTPPGHWNQIALFTARQEHLSPLEEARLFALLNLAMADAGIIAWKAKYQFALWRPVDAIRKANGFAHTARLHSTSWVSLLESPPHPEYPSGHGCYSGAAAEVLKFFFESDSFDFFARSDSLPGTKRFFRSFSTCAREIANSRLWGGIHFSFSNESALQSGEKVAKYICQNFCTNLTK